MLYTGKLKCVCWYGENFTVGKIYNCEDGYIINNKGSRTNYEEYPYSFIKVNSDKIELLLPKNVGQELRVGDFKLTHQLNEYELHVFSNGWCQHSICWGEQYNKTIEDVKPLLDALNIEIIEESPKYTIDSTKEYTEEEVKELEKLGIKFKKVD